MEEAVKQAAAAVEAVSRQDRRNENRRVHGLKQLRLRRLHLAEAAVA